MERRRRTSKSSDEKSPPKPKKVKLCRAGLRGKKADEEAAELPGRRRILRRSATSQPLAIQDPVTIKTEPDVEAPNEQASGYVPPRRLRTRTGPEVSLSKVKTTPKQRTQHTADKPSLKDVLLDSSEGTSATSGTSIVVTKNKDSTEAESFEKVSGPSGSSGDHAKVHASPGRIRRAARGKKQELVAQEMVSEPDSKVGARPTKRKTPVKSIVPKVKTLKKEQTLTSKEKVLSKEEDSLNAPHNVEGGAPSTLSSSVNSCISADVTKGEEPTRAATGEELSSPRVVLIDLGAILGSPSETNQCENNPEVVPQRTVLGTESTECATGILPSTEQKVPSKVSSPSDLLVDVIPDKVTSSKNNKGQSTHKEPQQSVPVVEDIPDQEISSNNNGQTTHNKPQQQTTNEAGTLESEDLVREEAPGESSISTLNDKAPVLESPSQKDRHSELIKDNSVTKATSSEDSPSILRCKESAVQEAPGKSPTQGSSLLDKPCSLEMPSGKDSESSVCKLPQVLTQQIHVTEAASSKSSSTIMVPKELVEKETPVEASTAGGFAVRGKATDIARLACLFTGSVKIKQHGYVVIKEEVRDPGTTLLDEKTLAKCLTLLETAHSMRFSCGGLLIERGPISSVPQNKVELVALIKALSNVADYKFCYTSGDLFTEIVAEKREQAQPQAPEKDEQNMQALSLIEGPIELTIPYRNTQLTCHKRMCQPGDFGAGVPSTGPAKNTQATPTQFPNTVVSESEVDYHQAVPSKSADSSIRHPVRSAELEEQIDQMDGPASVSGRLAPLIQQQCPSKRADPSSGHSQMDHLTNKQHQIYCVSPEAKQRPISDGSMIGTQAVAVPSVNPIETSEVEDVSHVEHKGCIENTDSSTGLSVTSAGTNSFPVTSTGTESLLGVSALTQSILGASASTESLLIVSASTENVPGASAGTEGHTNRGKCQTEPSRDKDEPMDVEGSVDSDRIMTITKAVTSQPLNLIAAAKVEDQDHQKPHEPSNATDSSNSQQVRVTKAVSPVSTSTIISAVAGPSSQKDQSTTSQAADTSTEHPMAVCKTKDPIAQQKAQLHEESNADHPSSTTLADQTEKDTSVTAHSTSLIQSPSSTSHEKLSTEAGRDPEMKDHQKGSVSDSSISDTKETSAKEETTLQKETSDKEDTKLEVQQKGSSDDECKGLQKLETKLKRQVSEESSGTDGSSSSQGMSGADLKLIFEKREKRKHKNAVQGKTHHLKKIEHSHHQAPAEELKSKPLSEMETTRQKPIPSASPKKGKLKKNKSKVKDLTMDQQLPCETATKHDERHIKTKDEENKDKKARRGSFDVFVTQASEDKKTVTNTCTGQMVGQNELELITPENLSTATASISKGDVSKDDILNVLEQEKNLPTVTSSKTENSHSNNIGKLKSSLCSDVVVHLERLEDYQFKKYPDIWARVKRGGPCSYRSISDCADSSFSSEKAPENLSTSISESFPYRSADSEASDTIHETLKNSKRSLTKEREHKEVQPRHSSDSFSLDDELGGRLIIDLPDEEKVESAVFSDEGGQTGLASPGTSKVDMASSKVSEMKTSTPKKKREKLSTHKQLKHSANRDRKADLSTEVDDKLDKKSPEEETGRRAIDVPIEQKDRGALALDRIHKEQTVSKEASTSADKTHSKKIEDKTSTHRKKHRKSSQHEHIKDDSKIKLPSPKKEKREKDSQKHSKHPSANKDVRSGTQKKDQDQPSAHRNVKSITQKRDKDQPSALKDVKAHTKKKDKDQPSALKDVKADTKKKDKDQPSALKDVKADTKKKDKDQPSTLKDVKADIQKRENDHPSVKKDSKSDTEKKDEVKEFDFGAELFKQKQLGHSQTMKKKSIDEKHQKHKRHRSDESSALKNPMTKKPKEEKVEQEELIKAGNTNDTPQKASEVPQGSDVVPKESNVPEVTTVVSSPETIAFERMVNYSEKSLNTLMHQTPPRVSVSFPPLRRPPSEPQQSEDDGKVISQANDDNDDDVIIVKVEPRVLEEGEILDYDEDLATVSEKDKPESHSTKDLDDSKELPAAYKMDDSESCSSKNLDDSKELPAAYRMDDSDTCSSSTETGGSRKRKWSSGVLQENLPKRKKLKRPFDQVGAFTPLHTRVEKAIKEREKKQLEGINTELVDSVDLTTDDDANPVEPEQMPDERKVVKTREKTFPVRKNTDTNVESKASMTQQGEARVTQQAETNVGKKADSVTLVPQQAEVTTDHEDQGNVPPRLSGRGALMATYLADSMQYEEYREEDAISFFAPSEASFLYDEVDDLEEQRDRGASASQRNPVPSHAVVSQPASRDKLDKADALSPPSVSHPVSQSVVSHSVTHSVVTVTSHSMVSDPVTSNSMLSKRGPSYRLVSQAAASHSMGSRPVISSSVMSPPLMASPVVSPPIVPHSVMSRPVVTRSMSPPPPPPITRTVTSGLVPRMHNPSWMPDVTVPPPMRPPFQITKPPEVNKERLLPHSMNFQPINPGIVLPSDSRNLAAPPLNTQNSSLVRQLQIVPPQPFLLPATRSTPVESVLPYNQRCAPPQEPQKETEILQQSPSPPPPPPPPPPPRPPSVEDRPLPPPPPAFSAEPNLQAGAKYKPMRIHELPPWEINRVLDRLKEEKGVKSSPRPKISEESLLELERIIKGLTKNQRWSDLVEVIEVTSTWKLMPAQRYLQTTSEILLNLGSLCFKELLATAVTTYGYDKTKSIWKWLTGVGVSLLVAADRKNKQRLGYEVVQAFWTHKVDFVKEAASVRYPKYSLLYISVQIAMGQENNQLAVKLLDDNKWLIPEIGHQSERSLRERRLVCLKGLISHFKKELNTQSDSQEKARKILFRVLDTLLRSYNEDQDTCPETIPNGEIRDLLRVLLEYAMKAKHCQQALEVAALLTKHNLTQKLQLGSHLRQQLIYFVHESSKADSQWFDVAAKLAVEATKGSDKTNRLYPEQLVSTNLTKPRIYLSPYMLELDMCILIHGILVELLDRVLESKDTLPIEHAQFHLRIDLVEDSRAKSLQHKGNGSVHEAHQRLRVVLRDLLKPPLIWSDSTIDQMHVSSDSLKGYLQAIYNKRLKGGTLFTPQRASDNNAYWAGPPEDQSQPLSIPLAMQQGITPMSGVQMDPRRVASSLCPPDHMLTWPQLVMRNTRNFASQSTKKVDFGPSRNIDTAPSRNFETRSNKNLESGPNILDSGPKRNSESGSSRNLESGPSRNPESGPNRDFESRPRRNTEQGPDSSLMPPPTWTPQRPEKQADQNVPQPRPPMADNRVPSLLSIQDQFMHMQNRGGHAAANMYRGGRPFERQRGRRQFKRHPPSERWRGGSFHHGPRHPHAFSDRYGSDRHPPPFGNRHGADGPASSASYRGQFDRPTFSAHGRRGSEKYASSRSDRNRHFLGGPSSSESDRQGLDRPASSEYDRMTSQRQGSSGTERRNSDRPASSGSEQREADRPVNSAPVADRDTDRRERRDFWKSTRDEAFSNDSDSD